MSAAILRLQDLERDLARELDGLDETRLLVMLRFAVLEERGRIVQALGGVTPDRLDELNPTARQTLAAALRRAADVADDAGGWTYLLDLVRALIDRDYPADLFTGESGDPGARFIVRLRDAIDELELTPSAADERELRLADVADVLAAAPVDEDGELDIHADAFHGLRSALQHALTGSSGCMEPDEWQTRRLLALERRREELRLP